MLQKCLIVKIRMDVVGIVPTGNGTNIVSSTGQRLETENDKLPVEEEARYPSTWYESVHSSLCSDRLEYEC
jgi:hypothetical protein